MARSLWLLTLLAIALAFPAYAQSPLPASAPSTAIPEASANTIPKLPPLTAAAAVSIYGADFVLPKINNREIVVTAVGDVMLGTTFPDDNGDMLPPDDGAGLLAKVTPILKRGDVVFGNLEGPLVDAGESLKCRGKKLGTCFAFRVPTRYGAHLKDAGFTV
ncbi:MAG TPA: CapA family protein, partial [Terriglobales bacterium]|nr:CapA family protein [Terriglobales bacterium]